MKISNRSEYFLIFIEKVDNYSSVSCLPDKKSLSLLNKNITTKRFTENCSSE